MEFKHFAREAMKTRTFTVTLEDLTQYAVTANYDVVYEHGQFSCWHEIQSVRPINTTDIALEDCRLADIESALAYLIVDECEDLQAYQETRYDC